HVLPRRVRRRDHRLDAGGAAFLRRLVPVASAARARLLPEGRAPGVRIHLASRHLPALALRHPHATRLEGAAAAGHRQRHRHGSDPRAGAGLGMADEKKDPSVLEDIGALAKGLRTTLGEYFSPQVTTEYPEEKSPRSERYRGRHYLRRYDNGL